MRALSLPKKVPLPGEDTSPWPHIMPYLSPKDLYPLSQVEHICPFVKEYLGSVMLAIDRASLEACPVASNMDFYKFIGRSAKHLRVADTLEMDIAPLLACFPNIVLLELRRVLIAKHGIKGFPVKRLLHLTLEECIIEKGFLVKWLRALDLYYVVLRKVNDLIATIVFQMVRVHLRVEEVYVVYRMENKNLKLLDIAGESYFYNISCPSLEYFTCESEQININRYLRSISGSAKESLRRVFISVCNHETVDKLLQFPNLTHLKISTPITDQTVWDYLKAKLESRLENLECSLQDPLPMEVCDEDAPMSAVDCSLTPATFDSLPNELLVRIVKNNLGAEDCIALTHVNRKLRSIVFEHIYPSVEMLLHTDFKRYPLDSRPLIYTEMGRRVQRLLVLGDETDLFNKIRFTTLKSLNVDLARFGPAKKIAKGLQVLHVHYDKYEEFHALCQKSFPTLTDLMWPVRWNTIPLYPAPQLRRFSGRMTLYDLRKFLPKAPQLRDLDVRVDIERGLLINDLMDTFKSCSNELTHLKISFFSLNNMWDLKYKEKPPADPILPHLQELQIGSYVNDHNEGHFAKVIGYFFNGLCTAELKILKMDREPPKEIFRFQNLRHLTIDTLHWFDEYPVNEQVNQLPKLKKLDVRVHLSLEEGLRLVSDLQSSKRSLCFNGLTLQSYADLLHIHDTVDLARLKSKDRMDLLDSWAISANN